MSLNDVPTEALVLALSYLTPADLILSVKKVSKGFSVLCSLKDLWEQLREIQDITELSKLQKNNLALLEQRLASDDEADALSDRYTKKTEDQLVPFWLDLASTPAERYTAMAKDLNCWDCMVTGAFATMANLLLRLIRASKCPTLGFNIGSALVVDSSATYEGEKKPVHILRRKMMVRDPLTMNVTYLSINPYLASLWFLCDGQELTAFSDTMLCGMFGNSVVYQSAIRLQLLDYELATNIQGHVAQRFRERGNPMVFGRIAGNSYLLTVTTENFTLPYENPDDGDRTALFVPSGAVLGLSSHGTVLMAKSLKNYVAQWVRELEDDEHEMSDVPAGPGITLPMLSAFRRRGASYGCKTSCANTLGVEVFVKPLFQPHASPHLGNSDHLSDAQYVYAYEIRMRLRSHAQFDSCQLQSRKWVTRDNLTDETNTVEGDGVIGEYPILKRVSDAEDEVFMRIERGECKIADLTDAERSLFDSHNAKVFEYISQTSFKSPKGTMSGSFQFVEGTLSEPRSAMFDVEVAPFLCCYDPRVVP